MLLFNCACVAGSDRGSPNHQSFRSMQKNPPPAAPDPAVTPTARYRADLERGEIDPDTAQERAVEVLQGLFEALLAAPPPQRPGLLARLSRRRTPQASVPGLYLWGGVGRGKTYLVDLFFECLPFAHKKRTHFHRFMHKIHEQLKSLRDREDPLAILASRFAADARILCFDEFIVNDIGDAMILSGLLKNLFDRGVTLVATSNLPPDELYKGGLQRDRFEPAIELIKQHTRVLELDGGIDYRLQFLDRAEIYFCPLGAEAERGMAYNFAHVAPEAGHADVTLEIDGRELHSRRHADGVVWFEFSELCGGPRSQNDYLELAQCFHTILVSNIPRLDRSRDDHARRLINLIDIMYDRNVKLIASAAAPPHEIYGGRRLEAEFERTASRMHEMQSHDYLARSHLA